MRWVFSDENEEHMLGDGSPAIKCATTLKRKKKLGVDIGFQCERQANILLGGFGPQGKDPLIIGSLVSLTSLPVHLAQGLGRGTLEKLMSIPPMPFPPSRLLANT